MTRLVKMKLLEDAIAVATKVNLDIDVIDNVVHSTQLQSLAAMVNAASVSDAPPGILQCVQVAMGAPPSSPLGSLVSGQTPAFALYGGSSVEFFLRGKRRCFQCNLPLVSATAVQAASAARRMSPKLSLMVRSEP